MYTDHAINIDIVKQIILSFNNTDKLNFRLVRAFIYLFQFWLEVKYRLDKRYVISNALSRLSIERSFLNENSKNIDFENYNISMKNFSTSDNNQAYRESLIIMFSIFRQQLLNDYVKKSAWRNFIKMLIDLKKRIQLKRTKTIFGNSSAFVSKSIEVVSIDISFVFDSVNIEFDKSITSKISASRKSSIEQSNSFKSRKIYIEIEFVLKNDFIYYLKENRHRFCISKTCETDIFRSIHDDNQHFDRHRCYQKIADIVYISRLFKKFRFYLNHCFDCQLN